MKSFKLLLIHRSSACEYLTLKLKFSIIIQKKRQE